MAEKKYIGAANATETISHKCGIALSELVDIFADILAADVVEVKRGEWLGYDCTSWKCGKPIAKKSITFATYVEKGLLLKPITAPTAVREWIWRTNNDMPFWK